MVEQLADAPLATLPEKLPMTKGLVVGAAAPKCLGPCPPNSTAIARLTPRSSATRTFCPVESEVPQPCQSGLFHHRAAAATGAVRGGAEEPIEDGRQLGFDIGDFGEFLVELLAAVLAVPLEAVAFARAAGALDDQAHGIGGAARRVRHVGRQQEDLAFADRDVHASARPGWSQA